MCATRITKKTTLYPSLKDTNSGGDIQNSFAEILEMFNKMVHYSITSSQFNETCEKIMAVENEDPNANAKMIEKIYDLSKNISKLKDELDKLDIAYVEREEEFKMKDLELAAWHKSEKESNKQISKLKKENKMLKKMIYKN